LTNTENLYTSFKHNVYVVDLVYKHSITCIGCSIVCVFSVEMYEAFPDTEDVDHTDRDEDTERLLAKEEKV